MKYFKNITDLEELRKEYRKLVKALHPDAGGTQADFVAMKKEYETLFKQIESGAGKTAQDIEKDIQIDKDLQNIIDRIVFFDINIEVCGSWIWIDGNTFIVKEQLKEIGFKWSNKRKKWHYSKEENTPNHYKSKLSFEEIEKKYGSSKVQTKAVFLN